MIDRFEGSFRWLSNFYTCDVPYEGIVYPSAEHAYVAAKTTDTHMRVKIAAIETPALVKKFGRTIALRDDWEAIKLQEMRIIVHSKFTHNAWLADKLRNTAPHELVEGNWWGDRFWGRDLAGYGSNHLGQILMEVRDILIED
jgi:ribA/ribD-fused uncharacterized protein